MTNDVVVLEGGSRDGESTHVSEEVTRLLAVSDAPGLLDVYEADGSTAEDGSRVFVHVGQESAEDIAPEQVHLPHPRQG